MIDAIFEQAEASIPEVAMRYERIGMRRLVGLCRELQRIKGTKCFHLGCRTVGTLLDVGEMEAQRWLKQLVADGILEVAKTHKHFQGRFLATEYRYIPSLDRVPR